MDRSPASVLFAPWKKHETLDGVSGAFNVGQQVTVMALGFDSATPGVEVHFELVYVKALSPENCECPPPGPVQIPGVTAAGKLRVGGALVKLSATNPFVVIDAPQYVMLRAVVAGSASDPNTVHDALEHLIVWMQPTSTHMVSDALRGLTTPD